MTPLLPQAGINIPSITCPLSPSLGPLTSNAQGLGCHCLGSVRYWGKVRLYFLYTTIPLMESVISLASLTERQRHLNVCPIHEAPNESSNMVRDSHLIRAVQVFRYSRLSPIANPGMGPSLTSDPYLYFSVKRVSSFSLPGAFEPIIETLKTVRNIVSPPVLT